MGVRRYKYLTDREVKVEVRMCTIDHTRCNTPGHCDTCVKTEPKVNKKSRDYKAGYKQALDDIRWGRGSPCYQYLARPKSKEDRMDEIRAMDKELKGGGNTDQD